MSERAYEQEDFAREDTVEKLIHKYKPLVYKMARRLYPQRPWDEDLLQCGVIGLWRASEVWDEERPFGPLAKRYVQGEMVDHLRRLGRQPKTIPLEDCGQAWEDDLTQAELRWDISRLYPAGSRKRVLLEAVVEGESLSQAARRVGVRPARARALVKTAARRVTNFKES